MKYFLPIILFILGSCVEAQNVVFVVIDGARYTETFGDESHANIPHMYELSKQGTLLDEMYNEHLTSTRYAIPALWTGNWEGSYDTIYQGSSTQAAYTPSIFEYFRKQKNMDASQCYYTLTYVSSLWLQSFHPDYGPDYWPTVISSGSSDTDVLNTTLDVIENHHPQLLWFYLPAVDHAGHSGDWNTYISAIQTADEIVNTLWTAIQNDPVYKDNTIMMVTNDHGRHDSAHGGFQNHGCSCNGCQHIMFMAIGPNIKENYKSTIHHETADAAVTASYVLDVNPEYATGSVMTEIFKTMDFHSNLKLPELMVTNNTIEFTLASPAKVTLDIYDMLGKRVDVILENTSVLKENKIDFTPNYPKGIYIVKLQNGNSMITKKFYTN
ncbi:MAG: T9SS type A sorting domain-containing protein [Salinivirgaceae bacterium]|nr:T9SS type A sorting domain-containing protein [Salinivirgaceae bacterium]